MPISIYSYYYNSEMKVTETYVFSYSNSVALGSKLIKTCPIRSEIPRPDTHIWQGFPLWRSLLAVKLYMYKVVELNFMVEDTHSCMHGYIHTYIRTYIHTYIHTYIYTLH